MPRVYLSNLANKKKVALIYIYLYGHSYFVCIYIYKHEMHWLQNTDSKVSHQIARSELGNFDRLAFCQMEYSDFWFMILTVATYSDLHYAEFQNFDYENSKTF